MNWRKLRPWLALVGPLLAAALLAAASAGMKAGELSWPKWVVAGVVAGAGILAGAWTPMVKARIDALAARTTRSAERDAQAEDARDRLPTRKGKVPLVADVTDRSLLGIHEAIPLDASARTGRETLPEMPTYVPRDIDADLRTSIAAHSITGGFVLLVGPAASGKTRSAYEAIRSVLPHWHLIMPGDVSTLNELITGNGIPKNSVIWLNEIKEYLSGSAGLKASLVRRLLAETDRPVMLVGTIWSTSYDQLRADPTNPNDRSNESEDFNREAREVLLMARRFTLGHWSDQEWERAEELTALDSRIAEATRHRGQMGLAQTLAAAPELVYRWEQADNPFGQSVITAAVAARRYGHPAVVPRLILESLAPIFLDDSQRASADSSWIEAALAWACQPVHHGGGISPIRPSAQEIAQIDGYRASDILVDHNGPLIQVIRQNDSRIWQILLELATPDACYSIGVVAYLSDRHIEAASAWRRAAAEAESVEAMFNLGALLRERDDSQGARTWLQRAAEAGHTRAMTNLGALLHDLENTEEAHHWLLLAADAGLDLAMFNLGVLLIEQGDNEAGVSWYRRAAEAGHVKGMNNLGSLLTKQGDIEGARKWFEQAAKAGHEPAMFNLGVLFQNQGDIGSARVWLERAANSGSLDAASNLGVLLLDQGETDEAHIWLQRAADAGHSIAKFNLGASFQEQGDLVSARTLLQSAAEGDVPNAMINLSTLLQEQGDSDGARAWLQRAAEAGNAQGMSAFGSVLREEGDVEGARTWWARAADAGNVVAMTNLGALLRQNGDTQGAQAWLQRAAEAQNASAMFNLGNLMQDGDDTDGARAWWTRAAEAGHAKAMTNLGALLLQLGDIEDARTWLQRAAELGLDRAMFNLGALLYQLGDADGARSWLQRAADVGVSQAQEMLSALDDSH